MDFVTLEKFVKDGLTISKIASSVNKSPGYVKYWLEKHNLKTLEANNRGNGLCVVCHQMLSGNRTKFCSVKCKNKYYQGYGGTYKAQKVRGQNRRKELLEKFGNKCSICSYNRNSAALSFHHKDGNDKDFGLDMRKISNCTWEKILAESEKCILVCMNCHAELHHPEYSLE